MTVFQEALNKLNFHPVSPENDLSNRMNEAHRPHESVVIEKRPAKSGRPTPPTTKPHLTLDQFRLISVLGRGHFGKVRCLKPFIAFKRLNVSG